MTSHLDLATRERIPTKAELAASHVTSGDRQDTLTDTLANLMHWADEHELDFDAAFRWAQIHHNEEAIACNEMYYVYPDWPWVVTESGLKHVDRDIDDIPF